MKFAAKLVLTMVVVWFLTKRLAEGIYLFDEIAGTLKAAQLPASPFPDHDIAYNCTPTIGVSAPIQVKFTPTPAPHFEVNIGTTPPNVDTLNPVIVSITNTAGLDVTAGAVKLLAANNGLPITITATDNTGIVSGKLEADGKMATPFGNGLEILPNPFYVRWNSKTIAAGIHTFRLTVCDASLNCAQRTWTMQK